MSSNMKYSLYYKDLFLGHYRSFDVAEAHARNSFFSMYHHAWEHESMPRGFMIVCNNEEYVYEQSF